MLLCDRMVLINGNNGTYLVVAIENRVVVIAHDVPKVFSPGRRGAQADWIANNFGAFT